MDKAPNKYIPEQTDDGSWTMRNAEIDECFHSSLGAQQEAKTLYLAPTAVRAEQLQKKDHSTLQILDIGLGLGYNALTFIQWWAHSATIDAKLLSLEIDPELVETLMQGIGHWQKDWPQTWLEYTAALKPCGKDHRNYSAVFKVGQKSLHWEICVGDARQADLNGYQFDVFWQDAFSPKKNSELWTTEWFEKLKACAAPSAELFTYSVAGSVKRALQSAGWDYQKVKTSRQDSSHKKQWLTASPRQDQPKSLERQHFQK